MNETTAALVTGGSRGIGAAVALRLAEAGSDVALTYTADEESADRTVALIEKTGRRGLAIRADAADPASAAEAVERTVAAFGRLDVLVNNAAVFLTGDLDLDALDRTLDVNVRAPYLTSLAAARHLTGDGRIVTIGSNLNGRLPFPGLTAYAMSKSAMTGLTKGLARDLAPRGITVVLVNPGPTDTDANPAGGPAAATIAALTATGRYATPAEIAETVLYACTAPYLTGSVLTVDGGFTI
ncbi:SDR family NAD(P)-dependent oxidoreductase [Actinocorallia longicatena]|uniref:SDR family oxidoreductase n=1 Tax=Actinocorallia longicatena TaxID=111803 RepID=A0ABP6Q0M2_9ACTN